MREDSSIDSTVINRGGTLAGDHADDDGQYIGDLFEANPNLTSVRNPPIAQDVENFQNVKPKAANILMTAGLVLSPANTINYSIVQVFPPDVLRTALHLKARGGPVQFHYDRALCEGLGFVLLAGEEIDVPGYTGAIFARYAAAVGSPAPTDDVIIDALAVTR